MNNRRHDNASRSARRVNNVYMLTNALAPDKLGGLERYVRELSAALVRQDISVTVLTKQVSSDDPLDETGADGVKIIRHPVPSKERISFALEYPYRVGQGVRSAIRRRPPGSIVHGHYAFTSLPLTLARSPYLYTFHAPVHKEILAERSGSYALADKLQPLAVGGVRRAEGLVARRAKEVVVLSEYMREQLREIAPRAAAEAKYVPGGIDVQYFSPGDAARDEWCRDGSVVIFVARRLTLRTGVRQLVEAMPAVLRADPKVKLAVAGSGSQEPAIRTLITQLGLDDAVHLLGRISDTELLRWYRLADFTVTPTQELEGFGLTTAESMACGTPALVTPVGANPELVADISPCLLTDGCSAPDLANAILSLMAKKDELRNLSATVRNVATSRWSWETVAKSYLTLYSEFLPEG